MPEGPEIHRAAAQLRKALVGRTLLSVGGKHPAVAGRLDGWVGREVDAVEARSKAMLIHVGEQVLYSHNQLYGRWTVNRATTAPRNWKRSLRVELVNDQHACRLWSASDVMLMDAWEVNGHPYIAQLGPDVADLRTTVAEVRVHLEEARFQRRGLAGLLLDQRFLAGVGNYLRSEILFFSGLRPEQRPKDLSEDEVALLARQIREVTRRSYRTGGLTELPEEVREAKRLGEPRRSHRHAVFGRSGKPCRRCGARIRRSEVGTRRLYLCPLCQPLRRSS